MKNTLLKLARESIAESLGLEAFYDIDQMVDSHPEIREKLACFVTIYVNDELRGCIGTINPEREIYRDVMKNAVSAATDERFHPIMPEEIEIMEIEISILSIPEPLKYEDKEDLISKIQDNPGMIIEHNQKSGLYLPSVWSQFDNPEDFLSGLCQKAGLEGSCIEYHPRVKTFYTDSFKDISIRKAGNKDIFYSNDPVELNQELYSFSGMPRDLDVKAIIVPHAGYYYSGRTAAAAYKEINKAKRVIVIGPSHFESFYGVSIADFEEFETPIGNLKIDQEYIKEIEKAFEINKLKEVHYKEHSTEVQMPMIKYFAKDAKVVEIVYNDTSVDDLETFMSFLLKDEDNILVITTDLSHFKRLKTANDLDNQCIDGFLTNKFGDCEACGLLALKAITNIANKEGYKKEFLEYNTSYDKTLDKTSVVGYMSGIVYNEKE